MMRYDQVRSSGDDTLLNIEINDAWRKITVTGDALREHLRLAPDAAAALTSDRRCDVVRQNMAFVFSAVRRKLRCNPDAQRITLSGGEL
jgi:hypothetical protein